MLHNTTPQQQKKAGLEVMLFDFQPRLKKGVFS